MTGSIFGVSQIRMKRNVAQKQEMEKPLLERTNDLKQANQAVIHQKEELQAQARVLKTINHELRNTQEEER